MVHPHYIATSSGIKNADAAISAIGAYLVGVELISDGTNTASLVLYDNASAASGVELAKLAIPASTTAPQSVIFNIPIAASKGIYADVTGTGATYIVYYSQGI